MGFEMNTRRAKTLSLTIPIEEQELTIRYRPQRVTPEQVRALVDAQKAVSEQPEEGKLSAERMAELVAELQEQIVNQVAEWDAVDSGVPIPLTVEGLDLAGIDIDLMVSVLSAIREAQSVPLGSGKP